MHVCDTWQAWSRSPSSACAAAPSRPSPSRCSTPLSTCPRRHPSRPRPSPSGRRRSRWAADSRAASPSHQARAHTTSWCASLPHAIHANGRQDAIKRPPAFSFGTAFKQLKVADVPAPNQSAHWHCGACSLCRYAPAEEAINTKHAVTMGARAAERAQSISPGPQYMLPSPSTGPKHRCAACDDEEALTQTSLGTKHSRQTFSPVKNIPS